MTTSYTGIPHVTRYVIMPSFLSSSSNDDNLSNDGVSPIYSRRHVATLPDHSCQTYHPRCNSSFQNNSNHHVRRQEAHHRVHGARHSSSYISAITDTFSRVGTHRHPRAEAEPAGSRGKHGSDRAAHQTRSVGRRGQAFPPGVQRKWKITGIYSGRFQVTSLLVDTFKHPE